MQIVLSPSLHSMRQFWEELEANALCSLFQSFEWCEAWNSTIGQTLKVTPIIVMGQTVSGDTAFILPFQIRKVGPWRVLEWLAQQNSSYGAGLYSHTYARQEWFSNHFSELLRLLPKFDAINFQHCPEAIMGHANPLSVIHRFKAANTSFSMALIGDFAALHESKRSTKSISKIRRRDERLKNLGALEITSEHTSTEMLLSLAELYDLKNRQLAELGVAKIFGTPQREFYHMLGSRSQLELYRLSLDGKTLSLVLGAIHRGVFYLLVTTLSSSAPLALSPGDMLLRHVIETCCKRGLERFDFSPGESDYKLLWADQKIQLYNYLAASSLRGLPYSGLMVVFQSAKRVIKTTPFLWRIAYNFRRFLGSRRT